MEKRKITRKEVKRFKNIISIGYCELANLLYFKNPDYYNTGVYGWNYNGYIINYDTIIITGYRPVNGNISIDRNISKKFDEEARKIIINKNISFEDKEKQINVLINLFIKELIKED